MSTELVQDNNIATKHIPLTSDSTDAVPWPLKQRSDSYSFIIYEREKDGGGKERKSEGEKDELSIAVHR